MRADLAAAQLEEHIQRVVDSAPPLTAAQREKLALLLNPGAAVTREAERRPPGRKSAAQTISPNTRITADQERVIRAAHRAMDLRGRGKSGVHTTTDACRVIRELLDVLAAITGIDSADVTLPFRPGSEA